ncbi:MAG: YbaB/EbfC family nucleoid-associated protein [Bdellovibrionota bacterium]|jgi:DNA-binding YbaB/EbfC family protein
MGKFGGVPGNMQAMLKQAQKMQQDLQKAQDKAKLLTAEGSSGGGMVKVVVNGENRIAELTIDKQVVDPSDVEMLQDLIIAAANEALTKVQEAVQDELSKVTGGINIPGLM